MSGRGVISNPLKRARLSSQRSPSSSRRPKKSPSIKPSPNKKRRLSNPETRSETAGSIHRTPSVKRQPKLVVRKVNSLSADKKSTSKTESTIAPSPVVKKSTPVKLGNEEVDESDVKKDVGSSSERASAIPSGGVENSSAKKVKAKKKDRSSGKKKPSAGTKRPNSSPSEEVEDTPSMPLEGVQIPSLKRLRTQKENVVSKKNSLPSTTTKEAKKSLSSATKKDLPSATKKGLPSETEKILPSTSAAQSPATGPSKNVKSPSPVRIQPELNMASVVRKKKKKTTSSEQSVIIHECSFLKPHVAGFTAIAASKCGQYVVVSNTDRNIELLRIDESQWVPVSIVYALSGRPDLAISTLKFSTCGRYLFAARLDGSLTIYDISAQGLLTVVSLQPGGGAIWDMVFAPGCNTNDFRLAIACDDGCVRFVSPDPAYVGTDEDALLSSDVTHYIVKASDTTPARTLSVDWVIIPKDDAKNTEGVDFIVCGDSGGGLRWIDPSSGRTTGRGNIATLRKEPVLIWTVRWVRNGNTIVCGDDRGLVTLWSSRTHTIDAEMRIEGMKGAIWCSSVTMKKTRKEEVVVFGGANGSIGALLFPHDVEAKVSPWRGVLIHTHDVRGICSLPDGRLLSAGIDSKVVLFHSAALVSKNVPVERPSFTDGVVSQPLVTVLRQLGLVVSHGEKEIEFWKIPEDQSEYPIKVLRMSLKSVTSELRCVAVSEDGMHVAVSTADSFKLYRIWDGVGIVGKCSSFGKVELLEVAEKVEGALFGCVGVRFCGSSVFAITRCRSKIVVFDHLVDRVNEFSLRNVGSGAAAFTKLSSGGGRVVACDSKGSVFECAALKNEVLDFGSLSWRKVCDVVEDAKMITSLSMSASGKRIAFAYDNMKVVVVNVSEDGFVVYRPPGKFGKLVNSISFSNDEKNLLISGENMVNVFASKKKKRAKKRPDDANAQLIWKFHKIPCAGHLWSTAIFGVGRVVLLRRRFSVVETYLPDAIPKTRFGG